jgi:hypothetical protein
MDFMGLNEEMFAEKYLSASEGRPAICPALQDAGFLSESAS